MRKTHINKSLSPSVDTPTALPRLPADGFVPVDLALASHSAVIVDVVVEFDDGHQAGQFGLVISREQCAGNMPHVKALLDAAKDLVRRLRVAMGLGAQRAGRVLARVAGQPVAIWG